MSFREEEDSDCEILYNIVSPEKVCYVVTLLGPLSSSRATVNIKLVERGYHQEL
ncbi:hypothetical protein J6590_082745 [Homalodisca vitripennis]|nr:hypothetical protein J6590_082745 [Homalodisca vitripennis]